MLFDTLRLVGVEGAGWRVEFIDACGEVVLASTKTYHTFAEALDALRCFSDCVSMF